MREKLATGLFNAIYYSAKAGEWERTARLLEELLELSNSAEGEVIREVVKRATMTYCRDLLGRMKAGEVEAAKASLQWLEAWMPARLADLLRPVGLAVDVLEKGNEKALAREPEEVRRVVQMLLEKSAG